MVVGSADLLVSDAAIFAQRAAAAGAAVELHLYDCMWHVFQLNSQGCGSGRPVVLANSAISTSVSYLQRLAAEYHNGSSAGTQSTSAKAPGVPCTVLHYEYPRGVDSGANYTCV